MIRLNRTTIAALVIAATPLTMAASPVKSEPAQCYDHISRKISPCTDYDLSLPDNGRYISEEDGVHKASNKEWSEAEKADAETRGLPPR